MTSGFLNDMHGIKFVRKVAFDIAYNWRENKEEDDFCGQYMKAWSVVSSQQT